MTEPEAARGDLARAVLMREGAFAGRRLAATFLAVLTRPRRAFAALGREPSARAGAGAVAVLGLAWGGLCAVLFAGGHAPPFVLLPIARERWYAVQALVSLPVLLGLWWLFSEVAHRLARAGGGTGAAAGVRAALGFAYAAPLLLHVTAELIARLGFGREGLRAVAPVSLPLAALGVWALSMLALREVHGVSWARATLASLAGLVAQAVAGSLVLR